MKLLCALGGHEAGEIHAYSGGYHFSQCRRCGTAMIRLGAAWQDIPDGHAVVWRSGVRVERLRDAVDADASVATTIPDRDGTRSNAARHPAPPATASLPAFALAVGSGVGRLLGTHGAAEVKPEQRLNRG
ncbi:hypothetical protein [Sphingosinicella sp. BN140058]|uniref:hypothetical protein n=1 Tax=Sphingosinicella sp. BN140058 TaxID=1892855 RepID=UPI0010124AEF|nr:hypothetical protein [Sphingosinicella sp. BN140058]QAY78878.1 hypothetical protein ETR14_21805 [Sphingosinicella sp. BN140058]